MHETEESILEWEDLKSNIFELECEEAASWQQNAKVNWLREGNEPKPFFFRVVKDK